MKNTVIILLFALLSAGKPVQSQQQLADSVRQILNQQIPDTVRAYNMVMLAMYTEPLDLNKAHVLYKEATEFSLNRKLDYYAGLSLLYEATPYNISGEYNVQRANLLKAAELLSGSKHYKAHRQLGNVYGGLSGYYRSIEKFDSAVFFSLKSISIQEELKSYNALAISCINLSMIYQQLKLSQKQKEYADKGLRYALLSGNKGLIMVAYLHEAQYRTELNDFQGAKLYVDSASVYYNEDYEFSKKQNFLLIKASVFQNTHQYDSAVYYYKKCYDLAGEIGSRRNMTEPLMQIGYVYSQQQHYAEAEKYVKMGLQIAEKDSLRYFMKEGYGTLSDIYAAQGKYKEAFELIGQYNEIKDTLLNEERKKFSLELEEKYETEKQKNIIQDLEAEKLNKELALHKRALIIQALAGISFTILVISLLLYRNFKQKQRLQESRIQKLEAEKLLSATEAVLKGAEQERTRLAKDLHDGLGGMLSGIKFSFSHVKENLVMTPENQHAFDRSLEMLGSSIHELRRIAHNMMPESLLKFGLDAALNDFCADFNNSGTIKVAYQSFDLDKLVAEQTTVITVYRIVQELLNNVRKHASATEAIVQLIYRDKTLTVTVEDNGKGFDQEKLQQADGIGWKNIKSRVEYLDGTWDIQSEPGKGTAVNIEIRLA